MHYELQIILYFCIVITDKQMDISIIIPVYNKEAYVRQCLTQALSQDYNDYEVIAVDDGSRDASGDICDEMAGQYPRLRVIHKENGGVTAARRTGVEEAQGQYIMFCDSDDMLLPHALRHTAEAMKANNADEVIAPYQNQYGTVKDSGCRGLIAPTDVIKDYLALRNNFPPIWGMLLRRDIILDGCLDIAREIYLGEDILFHIRYLTKVSRVCCISQSCYVYSEGITSYPRINLDYESRYDQLMQSALQPVWADMEPFFRLRQLKVYEKFIDNRQFDVYDKYYHTLKDRLSTHISFTDRLVFALPPRLAYYLVHGYKWWLQRKSKATG